MRKPFTAESGSLVAIASKPIEGPASSMTALDVNLMNLVLDDLPLAVPEAPAVADPPRQSDGTIAADGADIFSDRDALADRASPGAHSASTLVPGLADSGEGLPFSALTPPLPPPSLPSEDAVAWTIT